MFHQRFHAESGYFSADVYITVNFRRDRSLGSVYGATYRFTSLAEREHVALSRHLQTIGGGGGGAIDVGRVCICIVRCFYKYAAQTVSSRGWISRQTRHQRIVFQRV